MTNSKIQPSQKIHNTENSNIPKSVFSGKKCPATSTSVFQSLDKCHIVNYEGMASHAQGIYFQKYNKDEEPFIWPIIELVENDLHIKDAHQIIGITNRIAPSGEFIYCKPGSEFYWKLFVCFIQEDNDNPAGRMDYLMTFVAWLNSDAMQNKFDYKREFRIGTDFTTTPPRTADSLMHPRSVCSLMLYTFQGWKLTELLKWKFILSQFWKNINTGATKMLEFGDPQFDQQRNVLGKFHKLPKNQTFHNNKKDINHGTQNNNDIMPIVVDGTDSVSEAQEDKNAETDENSFIVDDNADIEYEDDSEPEEEEELDDRENDPDYDDEEEFDDDNDDEFDDDDPDYEDDEEFDNDNDDEFNDNKQEQEE
jgi:hypothetical protein